MKIVETHALVRAGAFARSKEWQSIRDTICEAIQGVVWPPGSDRFMIYPESGKARGEGNGVKPIKDAAILYLAQHGWRSEYPWPVAARRRPGKIDAVFQSSKGLIAFEWETGNVSSSHRALNKLCLSLIQGVAVGGVLVVPSRKLYRFLTDRIGNVDELEPYFDLWSSIRCEEGVLEVIVVEHDEESLAVPRIEKGTDGRNLI